MGSTMSAQPIQSQIVQEGRQALAELKDPAPDHSQILARLGSVHRGALRMSEARAEPRHPDEWQPLAEVTLRLQSAVERQTVPADLRNHFSGALADAAMSPE